jgi:hypothetical protein
MAGFGDSNDIKINVTLDTEGAIKSAEQLKSALESGLKSTEQQFKKIEGLSKSMSAVLIEEIKSKERIQLESLKNEAAAERRRHLEVLANANPEVAITKLKYQSAAKEAQASAQQQIAAAQRTSDEKIKADQRAADNAIKLRQLQVREAEAAARQTAATESTLRTQILENIAKINQATARIKKPTGGGLGDTAGSGKLVDALKNSVAGLSLQFGNVNVGFASFINNFKSLGIIGGSVAGIVAAVGAIQRLDKQIDQLAEQANKVEGLAAGFQVLQRTVGQDPSTSIQKLRDATQGLISDVQLYQRANQAVLLGVPTDTFNQAAAAAVKLGRAMGIDAAFGLESLSLGLGRQSRLYLDNLGIIVSAEQAYANFAMTVGKTANDLTDSEKKQAFFAEALKKIKERAEELPDPLDTVGVALQRLQAAQENANTKFSEGINTSKALTDAYKDQAKQAALAAESNERYGAAVGLLGGFVKQLANDIRGIGLIARNAGVEIVGAFADLTPEERLQTLDKTIKKLEESTNQLREARSAAENEGDQFSPTLANRLKEQEAALVAARKETEALTTEIARLRGEGAQGVKINVDISAITEARSAFTNLFAKIKEDTLKDAGQVEVPGIAPEVLQQASIAYEKLVFGLDQGTVSTAKFNEEFAKLQANVGQSAAAGKVGELTQEIAKLQEQSKQAGADQNEFSTKIKIASEQLAEASRQGGLYGKTAEKLGELLVISGKKGKKASEDLKSAQKDAAKQSATALKQQEQQLKDLTKSLGRSLGQAIPKNVQQQLLDVFNEPQQSAEELRAKIEEIGKEFLKAGGDYQAFAREVKGLNDLKNQIPDQPLSGTSESINEARQYNKELAQAQEGLLNIRKLIYGDNQDPNQKAAGGGFFGFDLGENATQEMEAQIAGQFQDALAGAFQAGADGFSREDVPGIAASIGSATGAAIAASIGVPPEVGAAIGNVLGQIVGESLAELGKDLKGTQQRKQIDKYFGELFDGGRLGLVIQGQIRTAVSNGVVTIGEEIAAVQPEFRRLSDLVFEGFTPFAGQVRFGGEGFFNYFNTLSSEIQNSFNGVGLALGTLQGISAEQARLIGVALSNNIGGSLQNLQVLVQQTGESFENLSQAILKAFRDSQLTAEEAYNALVQLQNIYSEGIPGAIGDFQQAIDNLNTSLKNEQPGQYALDSLRDIGAEGQEARASFESVISSLGQTFGFAADQQARLFEALRLSGIATLADLAKASDAQLLTLIRNINAIKENAAAPLAAAPTIPSTKTGGGGGSRKKSPQEIAKELLEKQREEARKLLQDSQAYLNVIKQINNGQLTSVAAGKEIVRLQKELLDAIIARDKKEKELNAELDKGAKGNKKRIGELSQELAKLEEKLEKAREKANEVTREYKTLNIEAVIPLIKSQNSLGVVARQIGVDLQKNVDILVKGFMQGRLSISEANKEIAKTKELLGPGIPNAVGAVSDAFQNLIDAGTTGGAFSADAFVDIFAEFREKFNKEGSALREVQRKQLNENLDAARAAARNAVGPEASEAAQKALALAKKALDDFRNEPLAPDLSDLKDQLKNSFSTEQVETFFRALDESGLKSLEEFENAGSQKILSILGRLEELGFKFRETSDEAKDINKGLQDAETAANAGLDPLKQAIDLVKQFNDGAATLPPAFNSTTEAIGNLNGPLEKLASGFDKIIEKLGLLSGNTFENDVVFNIRTTGDQGGQALVELIFGNGSQASAPTGSGSTTGGSTTGGGSGTTTGGGMGNRSDWIRQSPGIYKNRRTGKIIRSRKNPGA